MLAAALESNENGLRASCMLSLEAMLDEMAAEAMVFEAMVFETMVCEAMVFASVVGVLVMFRNRDLRLSVTARCQETSSRFKLVALRLKVLERVRTEEPIPWCPRSS